MPTNLYVMNILHNLHATKEQRNKLVLLLLKKMELVSFRFLITLLTQYLCVLVCSNCVLKQRLYKYILASNIVFYKHQRKYLNERRVNPTALY